MTEQDRKVHPNALPNHKRAVIPDEKLVEYCLNPTHPVGKHKAIVFRTVLGFDQSNWQFLKEKVLEQLPYREAKVGKQDIYGTRYEVSLPISGPNGNIAVVIVTWIVKAGAECPSLTSMWVR